MVVLEIRSCARSRRVVVWAGSFGDGDERMVRISVASIFVVRGSVLMSSGGLLCVVWRQVFNLQAVVLSRDSSFTIVWGSAISVPAPEHSVEGKERIMKEVVVDFDMDGARLSSWSRGGVWTG